MRVLAVLESTPTLDPRSANGSTLISTHLLRHLPADLDVDVLYFADRPGAVDPQVAERARSVRPLPLAPAWRGWASLPLGRLPRASALRAPARPAVRAAASEAEVVYLHGLHTFPLAAGLRVPVVGNEVDPWSEYWRERARGAGALRGAYDRVQARRAAALERASSRFASTVVVSAADAARLAERTGGRVVAVPNGVDPGPGTRPSGGDPAAGGGLPGRQVCFVGSLDYPPNVEALTRLVREVWPAVREAVPDARLVVAGRRPGPQVEALAGAGVEVVGPVEDVAEVFRRSRASAYVGVTGRGTKNTVAESVAAGCPVVASPESARGHGTGAQLEVADGAAELAAALCRLLLDDAHAGAARRAARAAGAGGRSWVQVAEEYAGLLRAGAGR